MKDQFEVEQDYDKNDLERTELAGGIYDNLSIDEEDTDTGLKDDELIFNDDDNEEYADGRPNNAGSGTGDNMDDNPDF